MITLSPDQKKVHDAAVEWSKKKKRKPLKIGGYAGTGKTVLTAEIARTLRAENPKIRIVFCCFTGKAAYVLRTKLDAAQVTTPEDYVGTIHGIMYKPVVANGVVLRWVKAPSIDADLIIVDEASMVGEVIWNDLVGYRIPILAIGDHGQLPPIGSTFSLMDKPDHTLEMIHRQAEGNPIIELSIMARLDGTIPFKKWHGKGCWASKIDITPKAVLDTIKDIQGTQFLCGRNSTRSWVNKVVREKRGFLSKEPMTAERIICLKNNRSTGVFNGMGGVIVDIKPSYDHWYMMRAVMDDGSDYDGMVVRDQFGAQTTLREHPKIEPMQLKDLFDWGYCLTVHKAQGSEADNVVVFEERFSQMSDEDWRRWLYTAVTRARKNLLIVGTK